MGTRDRHENKTRARIGGGGALEEKDDLSCPTTDLQAERHLF